MIERDLAEEFDGEGGEALVGELPLAVFLAEERRRPLLLHVQITRFAIIIYKL